MKNIKEKSGITLIALAVTIIVILILAGVTIDAVFSENGIINKAKEAANAMNNAVANDQAELNNLLEELNEIMNSEWEGNTDTNTEPEIPEKPTDIEDVTDIQEETVQVEDEYGNKLTIPKGFEVVEEEGTTVPEGIVIQDKDGNQFVWIPVGRVYKDNTGTNYSDIQLGRYTFNTTDGTPTLVQAAYTEENPKNYENVITLINEEISYQEYSTRSNPDGIVSISGVNAIAKNLAEFVDSIKKYRGYYLARYEASYGSGTSIVDYKPLSKVSTSTTFSQSTIGSLWHGVNQIDAAKISRNMYSSDNNVGVESDLINSYAYDTAIVFVQYMGNANYSNKTTSNTTILNTGLTNDKVCNIYDLGVNCFEWTTEYSVSTGSSIFPCVYRGGMYFQNIHFSSDRGVNYANANYANFGFRVVTYIK